MKPRLLIIHNRFVIGGPALDTIPLAYHLKDEFDIHILYGCKEKDEIEPWFLLKKYMGLKLTKINSLQRSPDVLKDYKAYRFIKRYIKEFNPQIIHTHGAKAGFFGRWAAMNAKIPSVHTFHGHLFHSYFPGLVTKILKIAERFLINHTTRLIAISKSQKAELETILAIPKGKTDLIPLGIDYIDCSANTHFRQAFKRDYRINADTICVGLLGRIVPIKNPIFFLEVAKLITKKYPDRDIRFFIIGDGTGKEEMKSFLHQNNLEFTEKHNNKRFVFTSWIEDVNGILAGLDIVTLTSLNEGTPMSLIEAQMCGIPVVAVNVGGVSDTIIDKETGFLIQSHNVEEFAEAIVRLAINDELRKSMGQKAKDFAFANFSKEKEIAKIKELYLSLLN